MTKLEKIKTIGLGLEKSFFNDEISNALTQLPMALINHFYNLYLGSTKAMATKHCYIAMLKHSLQ